MSIEKSYNSWAAQYDTNNNKTRDLDSKATVQTLINFTFKNVVELGCGTGKNTTYLLERSDNIIALDFSEEMLKKAKAKIDNQQVNFQKTDITKAWPVKNEFADLITCNLVLEHIEDIGFIFKEANRVLKKEGIFFISELHPFKQYSGSKAQFKAQNGTQKLETYVHHISEYLDIASKNGFELLALKEWFDEKDTGGIPRLIGITLQKVA